MKTGFDETRTRKQKYIFLKFLLIESYKARSFWLNWLKMSQPDNFTLEIESKLSSKYPKVN